MGRDLTHGIDGAYSVRTDLLVVALTGRTGSGCTTTAQAMASPISQLSVSIEGLSDIEKRKFAICREFAAKQWHPFKVITVSTVIFSFLMQEEWDDVEVFLKAQKLEAQTSAIKTHYDTLRADSNFDAFIRLATRHDLSGSASAWRFYTGPLSTAAPTIRDALKNKYAPLFQTLGDNIRRSGSAIVKKVEPKEVFALITRVKRLAKAARRFDQEGDIHSTRIVIDAVRNPLELVYLRDQFAAFYAIAITADDEDRRTRLMDNAGMSRKEVDNLDAREYSKKPLQSYDDFVSQNLKECIQKSDLFFNNPGRPAAFNQNQGVLNRQVIRYVSLMLRPGLVTPTPDERCMQLAFVRK